MALGNKAQGRISRWMSVQQVSVELCAIGIDRMLVDRLRAECVDGEALMQFTMHDFAHFGIKYGPMVKIRGLLMASMRK